MYTRWFIFRTNFLIASRFQKIQKNSTILVSYNHSSIKMLKILFNKNRNWWKGDASHNQICLWRIFYFNKNQCYLLAQREMFSTIDQQLQRNYDVNISQTRIKKYILFLYFLHQWNQRSTKNTHLHFFHQCYKNENFSLRFFSFNWWITCSFSSTVVSLTSRSK